MARATINAVFSHGIDEVWNLVTTPQKYSWRSDIEKVNVLSETQFAEYTKDGFETIFTITQTIPNERWEFDIDNDNITGHWIGIFSKDGPNTKVDFTEEVYAKKKFMALFLKPYLKKQQETFIADLKSALDNSNT